MSESVSNHGEPTIASSAPPYLQCIQWVPRRFAGGISPVTIVDLVFEQRVFRQVAEHIAAVPGSPVFGALVGHLFEDPTCQRRWARVERTVRSPSTIPESSDASRLGQTLRATEMEWVPEEDEVLLGWYRTHLEGGLYLSPEEARFHEGGFPEPWSVALVLAGTGERRAGGVFQRTDPEGLSRSVYTPFYELVDPSSEFNGTTKRTFAAWANYQTETRILRAGHGSISDALPERVRGPRAKKPPATATSTGVSAPAGERKPDRPRAEPPPAPVGPITAPGARKAGPPRVSKRPRQERAAAPREATVNSEAEWEKRQIQRSLMAVERSLSPSDLGALGAPISDTEPTLAGGGHVRAPQPPATGERDGGGAGETVGSGARGAATPSADTWSARAHTGPTVIPIRRDHGRPGLVGRSRRRRRVPAGKILAAAAGLTLVATAGLVGARTMMRDGAAGESPDGTVAEGTPGSSMAGLTLSPDELRRRDGDPAPAGPEATPDSAAAAGAGEPVTPTDTLPRADGGVGVEDAVTGTSGADEDAAAEAAGPRPPAQQAASAAAGRPAPPEIVQAPTLAGLAVADPLVAAYENALAIFRQEADRYETVRRAFDDGVETCNPLNLSYRGVRDAFGRLERRLAEAGERLSGPTLRAFEGAERQFAMSRTHYMLTDCPMPVGG